MTRITWTHSLYLLGICQLRTMLKTSWLAWMGEPTELLGCWQTLSSKWFHHEEECHLFNCYCPIWDFVPYDIYNYTQIQSTWCDHGTWFYTITGIFALRSSVHTSRTTSQFSQKITYSQLSKVKTFHDALRITRCFTHHSKNRNASIIPHSLCVCKGVLKSFSFFLHIA